jgi:hypothetical protein
MKNITVRSCILFAIATSAPISLSAHEHRSEQSYSSGAYYLTHLITSLFGYAAIPVCTAVGFAAAAGTEALIQKENPLSFFMAFLGVVGGLRVFYKTPEWTDSCFFNKKSTTEKNILSLVCHLIMQWPLGTLVGTYLRNNLKTDDNDTYETRATS